MFRKIYKMAAAGFSVSRNPVVEDALSQLYPLEERAALYEKYQAKKLGLIAAIVFTGIVSVVVLRLCSRTEGRLTEGARLIKNEWGAGDYAVILEAANDDWSKEMELKVRERQLTSGECREMFENMERDLPERIKGKNQDLTHVESDLKLVTSFSGYPAAIAWNSSSERIDKTGKVTRAGLAETGEWVELTAVISYEAEKKNVCYQVYLLPEVLSEEEKFFRNVENALLKAEETGLEAAEISLPAVVDGQQIFWKEVRKDSSIYLLLLVGCGAFLAGKSMDKDLAKNQKKRERQLLAEYPDFVSKLRLYLSAGMTVRNVFARLTEDYREKPGEGPGYLQKELMIACNLFQNNVPEEKVYEAWGKRCAQIRYRRLSMLLVAHLKQGNGQLLQILAAEEESAREDRKRQAKKLGEEAGTKLLFPMLLQLLVVMFLILIPTYMNFGGI